MSGHPLLVSYLDAFLGTSKNGQAPHSAAFDLALRLFTDPHQSASSPVPLQSDSDSCLEQWHWRQTALHSADVCLHGTGCWKQLADPLTTDMPATLPEVFKDTGTKYCVSDSKRKVMQTKITS